MERETSLRLRLLRRSFCNLLACSLFLLSACNSDNVSWVFVSDPGGDGFGGSGSTGGSGGGAVIIIRWSSSSSPAGGATDRTLAFRNFLADSGRGVEPVDVHLVPGAEVALIARTAASRVELLCPLLPDRRVELPAAGLAWPADGPLVATLDLPDTGLVSAEASGAGRLAVGAVGTLLALEHAGGVLAWGDPAGTGGDGLRRFPAGSTITTRGDAVLVLTPDQRLERLLPVPSVDPRRQLTRPASGQLELIGPTGAPLARVPEANTTIYGGNQPLYVAADFPDGLAGSTRSPFALRVATSNRYLLRIDG